ncbi:hypothetical protein P154DRAFT_617402 [Amniculicola lignicola CBS 123094]|uniref:BAG domain-containing protein n=1 Tax=Amniculicola lignicola CBS 123094 TaxID=1392246 RepID=A0A6A5WPG4_9PLEO|nr:hypothetical protein P154DRAFT_617402 [Amniculicola lignicola CBS 123094]
MTCRANPALRTLLRSSTLLSQPQSTHLAPWTLSQQLSRRSPSPPPSLRCRTFSTSSTTTTYSAQWTRFATPYSLSSVRTFSSARPTWRPEVTGGASSPEAARRIEECIEEITELYATARDEFEIAAEETTKNTTYAPDDRVAAREELDKLLGYYTGIIEGGDRAVAEEVKRRVGGRIRELENAVTAMEESAAHGD